LFKKTYANAGLLSASYTWSKTLTDSSGWADTSVDSYNPRMDWGLANYDRPHILVVSYIYPFPSKTRRTLCSRSADFLRGEPRPVTEL
jgi:hypothetical protein